MATESWNRCAVAKANDTDIPLAYLRECFDLDPSSPSGLRWRQRPREHFGDDERQCPSWNARWAGKVAGTLDKERNYWRVELTVGNRSRLLKAHRIVVALTKGRWPIHGVDHEDRNPAVNKIANLREATQAQNNQNQGLRSDNTSGVKGVTWKKRLRKWYAQINVDGRRLFLGLFDTFDHACQARIGAESVLHPFRPSPPKPINPATIIPDGAMVTGVYSFTGKPKRVTYTYIEAA
jgi:hypothetical protein